MKNITTEIKGEAITIVSSTNTAIAAESGSLPVFGTPFMIALMEKATCDAASELLEDTETTVGTKIEVSHNKASGIGTVITATAILTESEGRKLTFEVYAKDDKGEEIGRGLVERFVVDTAKFLKRIENK